MFTTGSKTLIGLTVLATVSAIVYGIAQDGVRGTIGLASAAVVLGALTAANLYLRDSNVFLDDPAPVEGVRSGGLINRSEKAVFGEVSYDFTDRFRLLVGGRWFDWEVDDGTSWTFGGADFGFITNGVADGDEFFYKLSGEFRMTDETLVYASRSEGFSGAGSTSKRPYWGKTIVNGTNRVHWGMRLRHPRTR